MSLDETKPADTEFVSTLGSYARETRAAVNDLEDIVTALGAAGFYQEVNIPLGVTDLAIDTYLENVNMEIVKLTGAGAVSITDISGASEGMLKMFYFADGNVTFANNVNIALNQPAHVTDRTFAAGDWIVLAYIDTVWVEQSRLEHV